MQTRLFALAFGIVYVLVGVLGFISVFYTAPPATAPHVDVTGFYGYLLSLFPVNWLHDVVHIAVGVVGIIAGSRLASAKVYSQMLFFVFGALTVMGFMPHADTMWGLIPLFGNDTWLHAATAIAGAYFGYVAAAPSEVESSPATTHAHG